MWEKIALFILSGVAESGVTRVSWLDESIYSFTILPSSKIYTLKRKSDKDIKYSC
jgi:hypothetical protein